MKKSKNRSFDLDENFESNFGKGEFHHPDTLTPEEIFGTDSESFSPHSALEALRKRVISADTKTAKGEPQEVKPVQESKEDHTQQKTLLDKCMPYILDENGNDTSKNSKPLYELQSVAEILNNDSKRTLEKLSKEYGLSFEAFTPNLSEPEKPLGEPQKPLEEPKKAEPVQAPIEEESEIPVISDIDISSSAFYNAAQNENIGEQTLTFTPVVQDDSNSKIVVSTQTRQIDFTGELLKLKTPKAEENEELHLEKSDFEEFTPKQEYTDFTSGKELLKSLKKTAKKKLISVLASILFTLLTAFFMLPFMSNTVLTYTRICMTVTTVFTLLTTLFNYGAFVKLAKIFRSSSDSSVSVSLASIGVLAYCVFGIIEGEIILNMQLLLLIILSFNAAREFMSATAKLRSFKQIFNSSPKTGISLINDPAITLAMTKGSVEGSCLLALTKKTEKVEDFMKHYDYGVFLNGKMGIITAISVIVAVLCGVFATLFFDGILYGVYAAAAILCLTALPISLLIDALPLYHASKKLSKKGAMLAGKTGAELVEQANAVVINANDIFPSGTVTLHQMKVLSENNLEDTLLRAASLTETMQSPLSPIFKKIAGNSNITVLPDSDTVKYEEAMGISGWVDNRLLFIGNRTLMEAHGISVPDLKIDHRILSQGYFPVYVASGNKACALLIVRYDVNPEVAKELRRLTNSGVTVLVKTSDPNVNEAMICDYLGLYEDTVKVMTAAGCHIYVNTALPVKKLSAPAAYKFNPTALPSILNCASKFKKSNILLTAAYIITSVFGILLFAYASFGGSGSLLADSTVLLYSMISTAASYLLYLTQKP